MDSGLTDSGRVHFFYRESGVWSHQGGRSFIGVSANDITGASVAVDGRTVVYGVPKYDHEVSNNVTRLDAGRMIVYIKPQGSGWGYVHDPPGKAAGDQFGRSVAVDGDTAVVGAPSTDVGSALSVGTAYVHTRGSNLTDVWSEQATLTPSTRAANDQFGWSVAVDGDTAVVGAPGRLTYTGAVYVFTRDANGNWTEATRLSIPNPQTADAFGWSVAVDGDTVMAGAWGTTKSLLRRARPSCSPSPLAAGTPGAPSAPLQRERLPPG